MIGLEPTLDEFLAKMVEVFAEVKRVLRKDGTAWLNMGDAYFGGKGTNGTSKALGNAKERGYIQSKGTVVSSTRPLDMPQKGLKPKDLLMMPARLAIALQEAGWWIRSEIIWCLSGGTHVYAKTKKGIRPSMIRDLARLNPKTVKLWNGEKWTQVLGWSKSERKGTEIEIILRSGERISCTPNHKFPTGRGLLEASELVIGDKLQSCLLPEPDSPKTPTHLGLDAAWFAGLYLAEGSMADDTIQIAGHVKETSRWERLQRITKDYGGYITRTIDGNNMDIRIYSKMLNAVIECLVSGRTAKDKCFNSIIWDYSNEFIDEMLNGYLAGDGHWDEKNKRWRLGFTRNYNLERDLRITCARLGYSLTLKTSFATCNGKKFPSFKGELRKSTSQHHNNKNRNEITGLRKAKCRHVYDVGVQDEPHLFSLASGILTHNCKPNPMPESCTDRPTSSHEKIYLLTKSSKYFYDADAVREEYTEPMNRWGGHELKATGQSTWDNATGQESYRNRDMRPNKAGRNLRNVWTIATQACNEAHFATFPEALPMKCIMAGTKKGDTVLDIFSGAATTGLVALKLQRKYIGIELNPDYVAMSLKRIEKEATQEKLF